MRGLEEGWKLRQHRWWSRGFGFCVTFCVPPCGVLCLMGHACLHLLPNTAGGLAQGQARDCGPSCLPALAGHEAWSQTARPLSVLGGVTKIIPTFPSPRVKERGTVIGCVPIS